jgi:VIT1/CCC1 family predicted Fe2+/Mn2+ transporter
MIITILVTGLFLVITSTLMYVLYKNKLFKEMVVNIIIITISLLYCYNLILLWNFPSPVEFIAIICSPLSMWIFGIP